MEFIRQHKFIAIFRGVPEEQFLPCAQAIYDGGVRLLEITFDPTDPATAEKTARQIEAVRREFGGEIVVGAGTTVRSEYVEPAAQAGARFIVAPNTDKDVIRLTKAHGMLSMPGAFTPTEIVEAYQAGADVVKIFPIRPDDISYLKVILPPLKHIPFMPTGGVNPQNAGEFIRLGAVAVAAGATVVLPDALRRGDYAAIREAARAHVEAVQAVKAE